MVNTINPADCDRTTVYAGECRNFQDTEWITFDSGRRRSPSARDGNTWLVDVANGSFWMRDDQVRNLVPLVPARPVTMADFRDLDITPFSGPVDVLYEVVAKLNDRGGLGIDTREPLERALRERDEWRARAEAAEASTAPAVTRDEIEAAIQSGGDHTPDTCDCTEQEICEGLADATAAVWSLLSGDDPAVHVVRESDIEDCQRNEDGDWEFRHSGRVFFDSRDPKDRVDSLAHHREQIAQRVAIIRAIEAEKAVDPVEEQTDALADILYGDELVTDQMRGVLERVVCAGMLFPGMEADQ